MAPRTLEMDAFESALRQYAIAEDLHMVEEDRLTALGYTNAAEDEHKFAVRLHRAYQAERDDPEVRP